MGGNARKSHYRVKRKNYDKVVLKSLSVPKQAGVAVVRKPTGFVYLHQGCFTEDGLPKMIMRLTTFLASDFDLTDPKSLV